MPPNSRGANKYLKRETYNKNRTNDTGEIYDAASLLNIILCNPGEFHRVCKPVGIRDNFICTLNKKEILIASCRAEDNGVYIRKGISKKIFNVAFDETKVKLVQVVLCMLTREREREREREPTTVAYYRTGTQTISKARTMLSENCSPS